MKRKRGKKGISPIIVLIFLLIIIILFIFLKENNKIIPLDNTNNKVEEKSNKKNNSSENENTNSENTNIDTMIDETKSSTPKKDEISENKQEQTDNITVNIELIGDENINLNIGDKYIEYGAKATDQNGNDLTDKITIDNSVDTSKKGEYTVVYSIGNSIVIRFVKVN